LWQACRLRHFNPLKTADTVASTFLTRDIRFLPAVPDRRRRVIRRLFPNFPRKRSQKFTQYITEQPEMSSQSRELEEGQNKKNQIKQRNKR
jgi:hypothetical protein